MDASRRARRRCQPNRLVAKTAPMAGLKAIAKVVRRRETADKTRLKRLLPAQPSAVAERLNQVVQQHWSIENSLHWRLDVS